MWPKSHRKYGNKKVIIDGIQFDSKREAKRYSELKFLQSQGYIVDLQLQREFILIPAQYEEIERYSEKTGKQLKSIRKCIEHKCSYIADFSYIHDGKLVVEDTKGMRTKDYIIKRKLMLSKYGIKIMEI